MAPDSGLHLLEIQILGAELEKVAERQRLTPSTIEDVFGGRDSAIDAHFNRILKATGNPDLAARLLYVLALRNDRSIPLDGIELRRALHEPAAAVDTVGRVLQDAGMVLPAGGGGLVLRHDYIAAYFGTARGERVEPGERDNLRVRVTTSHHNQRHPSVRDPDEIDYRRRIGVKVFCVLSACTVTRAFGLGLAWTAQSRIGMNYLSGRQIIDGNYLPIAIAHTVWAFYVSLSFDNSYNHLRESRKRRALSWLVLINMVACVVAAYFWPELWVVTVGWGGVVLGMKMYSIGSMRGVSVPGAREFRKGGTLTIVNTLVLTAVGFVLYLTVWRQKNGGESWLPLSWFISIIISYAGIELTRRHVSPRSARQFLNLLAR